MVVLQFVVGRTRTIATGCIVVCSARRVTACTLIMMFDTASHASGKFLIPIEVIHGDDKVNP